MKKKVVSILLLAAMAASSLVGCGGDSSNPQTNNTMNTGSDSQTDDTSNTNNDSQVVDTADVNSQADEGQVINIYSFNDELRTRIMAVYPEIVDTSADGTTSSLSDGTQIHWVINPNQDGVYQDKLDEALNAQLTASADDKVDIFAAELDYIVK